MWLANFENGTSISSKNTFWTQLKEKANGAQMTGLQLSTPLFPNLNLCLADLDKYYFVTEAVALLGGNSEHPEVQNSVVAEIIGGHNIDLGIGLEIRLDFSGTVKYRMYPIEKFKYSKDILVG